jgi:hypothetical protein
LSSRLLSENIKIKKKVYIYIKIYLPFYMGVKLSLTLREEHRLRVYKNRVLRRIFGPKREEVAAV